MLPSVIGLIGLLMRATFGSCYPQRYPEWIFEVLIFS
jgi:hypothetical protein